MRRLLLTFLCVGLLSTTVLAQTVDPGSRGSLVVFESFNSGLAADATQAAVLTSPMTTWAVRSFAPWDTSGDSDF